MGLFGGRRDSLFVNPFKQVTKAPCKFHLLQGACSSPVVCSAPLFLPCSLQDYVIVDDAIVMGSTIAELAHHIQCNGGAVVGAVPLVNRRMAGD
jgi:hypothetical protein